MTRRFALKPVLALIVIAGMCLPIWHLHSGLIRYEHFPCPTVSTEQSEASSQYGFNSMSCAALRETLNGAMRPDSCSKPHDPPCPVTLVTGFYVMKSKHSISQYLHWMGIFLLHVDTPTVVYTDCDTLRRPGTLVTFASILKHRMLLMPNRTYSEVLDLNGTGLAREFGPVMWKQNSLDPERTHGHTYWLYLVWLVKVEALRDAVETNIFCSEWFLWTDIGSFRHEAHQFRSWPSLERLSKTPKDRIAMSLVVKFPKTKDGLNDPAHKVYKDVVTDDHIAGTFILANSKGGVLEKFYLALQQEYRTLIAHNYMIVKDQTVYNSLYLRRPELFFLVTSPASPDPDNCWRYFQVWLKDPHQPFVPENAPPCVIK